AFLWDGKRSDFVARPLTVQPLQWSGRAESARELPRLANELAGVLPPWAQPVIPSEASAQQRVRHRPRARGTALAPPTGSRRSGGPSWMTGLSAGAASH